MVDFYCYQLNLVIELDGGIHLQRKAYDAQRTHELKALGLTVVRYTNDQIFKEMPRVRAHLKKIMNFLESHPSLKERGWG